MSDILFKTDDYIFSYRVGGVLIHNGKVLMQNAEGDDGYAFIGGHVAFGETTDETLVREFKEEIGADIKIESFVLYEKGEGLEKREDDFAEEIAKLTGKA